MSEPSKRSWSGLAIKAVIALVMSVASLAWAFHGVDLDAVWARLEGSAWGVVFAFFLVQFFLHGLRVLRWALLVRPLGPASPRAIFAAASIGFAATFFLPLRLGEFVRPVIIRQAGVPFAGGMASVVVERIADGIFNLGVFFLLLATLPASAPVPEDLRGYAMLALGLFGGAFVVLILMCLARQRALSLLERLLSPISAGLAERVVGLLSTFMDGAVVLKTPSRLLAFVALTAAYWLLNGTATWFLAQTYMPGLPWMSGPFATSVVVFAIMIPAGPAFAGTLEAGFRFGLAPFSGTAVAIATLALCFHAVQLMFMAATAGLGFLAADQSLLAGIRRPAPGDASDSD